MATRRSAAHHFRPAAGECRVEMPQLSSGLEVQANWIADGEHHETVAPWLRKSKGSASQHQSEAAILRTLKMRSGRADLSIADFFRSRLLYFDVMWVSSGLVSILSHLIQPNLSLDCPLKISRTAVANERPDNKPSEEIFHSDKSLSSSLARQGDCCD